MDMAEAVGKPTLCLIEGACVGGGCEFSTACDIRIASETARMGVPIARLGLPIAYREMRRMVRLVGHAKTMELLLTAAIIPATEAHAIGLVNHVVPADEVEAFTYDMANKIAALAPVVHRVHKEILHTVLEHPALETLTPATRRWRCRLTKRRISRRGGAPSGETPAAVPGPLGRPAG